MNLKVLKKVYILSSLMILVLIQTFIVFPGLLIAKNLKHLNSDWSCAILISIFNFFDMIGKYVSKYKLNQNLLAIIVLFRNILVIYYFEIYFNF